MAVQALMAGANMALAAAPLFFGENNLFSGKARQATRMLERNYNRSQAMDIPQEMQNVAQQRAMRANQGLGSAALGLYQQEAQRGQASAISALGGRRSALAGIGNIVQAGEDAALRMAGMDEQARQQNRMLSEQTQMQVGEAKYQNELRKQQEAADYWGSRKAESDAAIGSALKGIGQAAGTAMFTGAFNRAPKLPVGSSNVTSAMQGLGIGLEDVMGTNPVTKSNQFMSQVESVSKGVPKLLQKPSVPNSLFYPQVNQLTGFYKKTQ
jgi:hypothetical protein